MDQKNISLEELIIKLEQEVSNLKKTNLKKEILIEELKKKIIELTNND